MSAGWGRDQARPAVCDRGAAGLLANRRRRPRPGL